MTIRQNSFETGIATGTAISVANSDDGTAGDAFDAVVATGTATAQFSTVQARDLRSGRFRLPGAVSESAYVRWDWTRTEWWWRASILLPIDPPLTIRPLSFLDAGADRLSSIAIRTGARDVRLLDNNDAEAGTSATTMALTSWFRLEGRVVHSLTTGILELRVFTDPDSDTPDEEVTASNINTGGASALANVRMGVAFGSTAAHDIYIDNVAISDEGWIGSGAPPASSQGFPIGMLPV